MNYFTQDQWQEAIKTLLGHKGVDLYMKVFLNDESLQINQVNKKIILSHAMYLLSDTYVKEVIHEYFIHPEETFQSIMTALEVFNFTPSEVNTHNLWYEIYQIFFTKKPYHKDKVSYK